MNPVTLEFRDEVLAVLLCWWMVHDATFSEDWSDWVGIAKAAVGGSSAYEVASHRRALAGAAVTAPTVRQLAAVRAVWRESKHAPTVRELGLLLDLSALNGVHQHLRALQRKGLVSWTPRLARTLALTAAGAKALQLHRPSAT